MSFLDAINAELNECLNKIDFKALYDAVVNINLDTIKAIAVHLKDHVHNIRPEHINNAFEEALKHVANDPVQAAIYLVWTIILIFPGIVTGPLLALLGLSEIGPVAGSLAAAFQSEFGATAVFSIVQSAAMGGYGGPVVIAGMRATWLGGAAAIRSAQGAWHKRVAGEIVVQSKL